MERTMVTLDGNETCARIGHMTNEVVAIYPITPSSPMGEWADQWSSEGKPNIWGTVPTVVEMQSEGGASGALHGSLQAGALTTTFTASQGLLLMLPNMYKIAGELTSTVIHVSARTVATHALSIFGDHSDVMATRGTGFALLASNSIQEIGDMALIAQSATLQSRVPFLHFFDGFRSSHEIQKVTLLNEEEVRAMMDDELVAAHRDRALNPDHPIIRGTAQNPDHFFQAREACNPYYAACPDVVQKTMDRFYEVTGRRYNLFDYVGAPDAERVVVLMGSGAEAADEAVSYMADRGEKVGLVKVHLYRPFSTQHLLEALPETVRTVSVLDRTKEPGAEGEPLFLDVASALCETRPSVRVVGGRYGLSSSEFTPSCVHAVLKEAEKEEPRKHFTVGITDDVTRESLEMDASFHSADPDAVRCLFFGLGSDGTVGANKNSIKIIGENTDHYAQGYFQYDSKKSGGVTVSHLRFGPNPIRSTYQIKSANFVGCHQFSFLERYDVLKNAEEGGTFLLNSIYGPDEVWDQLPKTVQKRIIDKRLRFYVIDGYKVAKESGMGGRINTVMQTCFFAISGILPKDEAIGLIKKTIEKTYGKKGEAIVQKNFAAVDNSLDNLHEVSVPSEVTSTFDLRPPVPGEAPEFVREVLGPIIAMKGDELPVSAMPADGTFPTGTTKWEKRNVALEIPVWDPDVCIQCGKCSLVCPHACIRAKVYDPGELEQAPETFKSTDAKWKQYKGKKFTIQIAPEDCTGCGLCVQTCPAKNKQDPEKKAINMAPQPPLREQERENFDFFLSLPETKRDELNLNSVKDVQLLEPLFEFSGACPGCGETPYVKLLSSLFGDRAVIANATGCSSIYCGNLPTTPWTKNDEGYGPTWSNSLFEDNAEFGMGMRLAVDQNRKYAGELLRKLAPQVGDDLAKAILEADQSDDDGIAEQRKRIAALKGKLQELDSPEARRLLHVAENLIKRSVWIMGGDGWAYDIGYGGLDHVLASGKNVNVLVMDTEVYSNTGGQMSKATPMGAVAKFAAGGKPLGKKDLALMAMTYGHVYVARVAMGASDAQTLKAFREAEAYEGPSLIIAYSHCIAHGYNLVHGLEQQKKAVDAGHWILMRYNPELSLEGKNPLQLDSKKPTLPLAEYVYNENRYSMLKRSKPENSEHLVEGAQKLVNEHWRYYEYLANRPMEDTEE
ncbi:MAG: pyruvate:ferredoxin (flavodoxin) oxidoreductase [Synergistales bacterium]|nr:pyruvate:ferredoxin (flavodoxin) oxidoreductase [Synergistales bacterium]